MESLLASLRTALVRWPVEHRYLIGVSGGVDSVVLLRTLFDNGYRKLVVCHLDHGLRGKTSKGDAHFVGQLAAELGFRFFERKENVKAEALDAGISLETAGRQARHRCFAAAARQFRCPRVFLAHHADDQAETVLMNLCRGSAGLVGMAAETSLAVPGYRTALSLVRPLLAVPKVELIAAASQNGWCFREDASNAISDVVRNRLRLEVLPLLDGIFQRPTAPAIARATAWTQASRAYLLESAAPWICQEKLRLAELNALPAVVRDTVLAEWLRAQKIPDISAAVLARAAAMLDPAHPTARWNLPGNHFLRRRAGWLFVERVPACGQRPG